MRSQNSRNNYVGGQGHHRYGNNSEQAQHQPSQDAHSVILVTAGYDHVIRFWEALSGVSSRTIQFPDSQVNTLCISPDKRYLAVGGHQSVKLYDIRTLNPNHVVAYDGHRNNVTSIGFHMEGRWMVTSSEDKTIKIWDPRTPTVQRTYTHNAPINDVCIHPNQGELIAGDQNGTVKIWNIMENTATHDLVTEGEKSIQSVSMASKGNTLVAGASNGTCYSWNLNQPEAQPTSFVAHSKYLTKCLISPNSQILATCSADATIKLWNIRDQAFTLNKTLIGHTKWTWDCAFSADSAYLVSASSDHTARLWELSGGDTIRQYNGHNKATVAVALNDLSV